MRIFFSIMVLLGFCSILQAAPQYPITVLYKKDTATSADRLDPAVQSALQTLDEKLLDANFHVIQPDPKIYEQLDRAQGVVVTFSPAAGYSLLLDVVKSKRPYSGTDMTYAEVRIRTRVFHGRSVLASYAELGTVAYKNTGAEDKAFEAAARRAADRAVSKIADRLASAPQLAQIDEAVSLVVDSSTPAPSPSQTIATVGKKWALMIGVSDFSQVRKKTGWGVSDLDGVKIDMQSMRKVFKDLGVEEERLIWLFNEKATTKNILSSFQKIKESSGPEDLVYIYLSTHGIPKQEGLSGFGIPVTYDMGVDNFIDFENFRKSISELKSNNIIWINDTCHSGMATQGMMTVEVGARGVSVVPQGSFRAAAAAGISGKNIAVFSSATEKQWAADLGPSGGLFTAIFTAGISQMLSTKESGAMSAYGFYKSHVDGKVQAKFKDICGNNKSDPMCTQEGGQQPVFAAQKDGKLLKM